MIRVLLSVLSLFLFAPLSFAEGDCVSAPNNYQALLNCAENRSPEIQNAKLEFEAAQKQVQAAGQWKNPEFAAETFRGRVAGETRAETDLSLGVPIELGGKISARKAVAQGEVSFAEAKLFEARAKVRAELYLKLHRLRQLLHEREVVDEAIGTFSKLIGQYSRRPGLSPEQQVSLSVFQLSKSEYDLKRSANLDEESALDSYFKLAVGFATDKVKNLVPQSPKRWPAFTASSNPRFSAKQRLLQAQVNAAQAEFQAAKSESWPTLTVGPSVKMVEESRASDQLVGFNVSLPIPLFNVNGGGRAAASANVQLAESRKQFGLREQELEKEKLLKIYDQSVKYLSTSLSHQEIERRHEEAEKLFIKGVVPSSMVIEAHRTSFELEHARHERELKALEALLGLYAIEGTLLENNL
jgi:cobalt-zinc-cadmium efflux system outer membrane protein